MYSSVHNTSGPDLNALLIILNAFAIKSFRTPFCIIQYPLSRNEFAEFSDIS